MEIRPLTEDHLMAAIEIKTACWPEELAGMISDTLDVDSEYAFWKDWMNTADKNNDIRLLLGAFENEKLLGASFASFVVSKDAPQCGVELNGLWVRKEQRGRGASLRLILETVNFFFAYGVVRMEVYNYHHAPSNLFFRKLGGVIIGNENQFKGKLPVDIFEFNLLKLKKTLTEKLENRNG